MDGATTETDFGAEPEALLKERIQSLDPSKPVLDVGCGVGRNLLWLARQGFRGDGIEMDLNVAKSFQAAAVDLPATVHSCPFQDFEAQQPYGTVLIFGLLPLLQMNERQQLLSQIIRWTEPESFVFLTGFTAAHNPGRWPGELSPGEIGTLLPTAQLLHQEEEIGSMHRHGSGPEHRHAWARAVFRI